jgi:exosortase
MLDASHPDPQAIAKPQAAKAMDIRILMTWPWSTCIFVAALLLLYAPVLNDTIHIWLSNDDYSHGLLVFPVSAYLVWLNRDRINSAKIEPNAWGFLFLGLGVVVEVVGYIGQLSHIGMWSLLFSITGGILLLYGKELWNIVRFPVMFLAFAAPISDTLLNRLTLGLVTFSSICAGGIMDLLGFTISRHGNLLDVPGVTLEIADACSGYHGLITMLAFSTLYAYMYETRRFTRILLILLSIPVALSANIVRICVLVAAGTYGGFSGYETFHGPMQYVEIFMALALLICVGKILGCTEPRFMPSRPA